MGRLEKGVGCRLAVSHVVGCDGTDGGARFVAAIPALLAVGRTVAIAFFAWRSPRAHRQHPGSTTMSDTSAISSSLSAQWQRAGLLEAVRGRRSRRVRRGSQPGPQASDHARSPGRPRASTAGVESIRVPSDRDHRLDTRSANPQSRSRSSSSPCGHYPHRHSRPKPSPDCGITGESVQSADSFREEPARAQPSVSR